ncbi:hypothetical protein QUA27_23245, partial [Microcoleus sp. Pol14C6]|uniref:hypothetical protein n=1 Tax=unclassified Microcoleus TaxID=2642155 RepID=UPI002FCFAA1D
PCAGKLASTVPNGREKVVTSSLDPTLPDRAFQAADYFVLVLSGWLRFYLLEIISCGRDRSIGTRPIAKVSRPKN